MKTVKIITHGGQLLEGGDGCQRSALIYSNC